MVIPTFAIKLEHFEEEEVMQKKAKLNGIPKLIHLLSLSSTIVTPKMFISL
jgi:hypothetical protein